VERLTAADFDGQRLRREGDWGVCFSADWCPFCRSFVKHFEAIEPLRDFHTAIGDLTDTDSPLWELFSIDVVPTMIAFRNGESIRRWDGILGSGLRLQDADALRATFTALGKSDLNGKSPR
jgi:thioredoxin-like negative regulator of GroEL